MISKRIAAVSRLRPTNGRGAIAVAFLVIAIVLSACSSSGNGDGEPGSADTPPAVGFAPQIVSSDLAVGDNRFILGLIDEVENSPVSDAQLHVRFFKLNGDEATLKSQGHAQIPRRRRDAAGDQVVHPQPRGWHHGVARRRGPRRLRGHGSF